MTGTEMVGTAHERAVRVTGHAGLLGWTFSEYADGSFSAEHALRGGWTGRCEERRRESEAALEAENRNRAEG